MSYCVQCGVELDKTADSCPLCHTPVVNPNQAVDLTSPKPYPPNAQVVTPLIVNHFTAIAISSVLLLGGIICLIIDVATTHEFTWSVIVASSIALFWIIMLLPTMIPQPNSFGLATLDSLCVIAYLYLMQIYFPFGNWFSILALPLVIVCGLSVMLIMMLASLNVLRRLSLISCSLTLFGAILVLLESRLDVFIDGRMDLGWSWIVFGIAFGLAILLALIEIFQSVKYELKKRLHL